MGARPSTFKKGGGGFLNNVDAEIVGYRLTDEFLGHAYAPHKFTNDKGKKVDAPHPVYGELAVRVDGADEDTLVPLKISNKFDEWEISDDEKSMEPVDGTTGNLGGSAAWQVFVGSLCSPTGGGEGFPEDRLPEDGEPLNWEPIIGTRVHLIQQVDEERTTQWGKRKNKKTGKEFDRTNLVVETVYSLPDGDGKQSKAAGKAGKSAPASKTATKPTGKGKTAPVVEDEGEDNDVTEVAGEALRRYLEAAPKHTLPKAKLRMKVLTDAEFKKDIATRDAVVKWLDDDDNLAGVDGVTYDADTKNQPIVLDE